MGRRLARNVRYHSAGRVQGGNFDGLSSCASWVSVFIIIQHHLFDILMLIKRSGINGIWLVEDENCQ